jgi:predicted PurR-regulated permease PerM
MFQLFQGKKPKELEITVTNGTVLRALALALLFFLFFLGLRRASHALTLIFVAFFLTLAVNTPVHRLAENLPGKKRGNRLPAVCFRF